MIVVPAIDVRGGKVVRLKQGRLQEETVYGADPVGGGAALGGGGRASACTSSTSTPPSPASRSSTRSPRIIDAVAIPVEVGGGLRVLENADALPRRAAPTA